MDIKFRNLLPGESKIYRKIRLESLQKFPHSFSANYDEALQTEKLGLENEIENGAFDKFVCGAFFNDELIGICVFVRNEMNTGSIYQMYVQEIFQGKNIGLRLVGEVIKEANTRYGGHIEIFLEVACDNYKAYNFYRKIGFEKIDGKGNNKTFLMKWNK